MLESRAQSVTKLKHQQRGVFTGVDPPHAGSDET